MAWKVLEEGHGFGYVEYWHPEDIAHPEHPGEIPEDFEDDKSNLVGIAGLFDIYKWLDQNYVYIIHVHSETYNYFRYENDRGATNDR